MVTEKDILVLKCNVLLRPKAMKDLYDSVNKQRGTGIIIVPAYIEPILVPANTEIKISERRK